MTTIAEKKSAKRAYDIARRPIYAKRKSVLRKSRKEKEAAATAAWKRNPNNWPCILFANARHRAKKYGIEFTIEKGDVMVPMVCPILGIELRMGTGNSFAARDCSPSLDRMDNSRGYTKGNVRIISWRANRLKNDATVKELEAIIGYMKVGASSQP